MGCQARAERDCSERCSERSCPYSYSKLRRMRLGPISSGSTCWQDELQLNFGPMQVERGKAYEAEPMRRWMDYSASARAWDKFFGRYGLGGMPDYVSYVCCAQFAVSR